MLCLSRLVHHYSGLFFTSDLIAQSGQYMQFTSEPWVILSPIEQSIKAKIEKYGTSLKDWDIDINYGIKTGCNEAFIIDAAKREELIAKDPKSAEIIRPILRGRDIKRYGYDFANLYLICTFPSRHLNIDDFPAVKEWLINGEWVGASSPIGTGKLRLEQTGATHTVNGVTFKSRKKTNNKWFETQDSINYWDDFSKPKIAWASVGETYYSKIDKNMFLLDTNYFFATETPEILLAFLNSKIITKFINQMDTPIGEGGAYRHYKYNFEQLPIIRDAGEYSDKLKELVVNISIAPENQNLIDDIICHLYGLTEAEKRYINDN